MSEDTITVTDGDTTDECEIIETYESYGTTVAEVQFDGKQEFVEIED